MVQKSIFRRFIQIILLYTYVSPIRVKGFIYIYVSHCVKRVQIRSFSQSVFSRIGTKYGEIRSISPYSVHMREDTDQKKLRIWALFTQWMEYDVLYCDAVCLCVALFLLTCSRKIRMHVNLSNSHQSLQLCISSNSIKQGKNKKRFKDIDASNILWQLSW